MSKRSTTRTLATILIVAAAGCLRPTDDVNTAGGSSIDRRALVERHSPELDGVNRSSPFTIGNGRFAFTADVTGFQSFAERYHREGIPLETKARWAWHSRDNPDGYTLADASESYSAYGREVRFPTAMESPAGQWLRQNPHDLPLARVGLALDGTPLADADVELDSIDQRLDLWRGILSSGYRIDGTRVDVTSAVHPLRDLIAARIASPLLADERLSLVIRFPRGYDTDAKSTPEIDWGAGDEHSTEIVREASNAADGRTILLRRVDDATHYVSVSWIGRAQFDRLSKHVFALSATGVSELDVFIEFSPVPLADTPAPEALERVHSASQAWWAWFWRSGAAVTFEGSTDPRAEELERRVVLSRYLMAVQSRGRIPSQETGLTVSSWYGKHHTEMTWWHTAHWALWDNPDEVARVLDWYVGNLRSARELAASRGLEGARWAKMVGPDNRESPGGNPLIIWNQPQPIHLAEMLYRIRPEDETLDTYADLVEESAATLSSMLTYGSPADRYALEPPIWIAQEIYDPTQTRNPAFELAYWRTGLAIAQRWRERRGLPRLTVWDEQLGKLAPLPQKDGRYVAIESIPDTFDDIARRQDHPTMLAPFGLLNDPTVDREVMRSTLDAVMRTWDFEAKIWGWDYPMIAMTATRLGDPTTALDALMKDGTHNTWLPNGHVPQPGADLPVYLPANGALLAAVAMMAGGWDGAPRRHAPGFPNDETWRVRFEQVHPLD